MSQRHGEAVLASFAQDVSERTRAEVLELIDVEVIGLGISAKVVFFAALCRLKEFVDQEGTKHAGVFTRK